MMGAMRGICLLLLAAALGCSKGDPYVRAKAAYDAKDFQKAFSLAEPAAEAGDAKSQALVGLMFGQGLGAPKDAASAVAWFKKSAEQGYASGQYDLGLMYANGDGVKQDLQEARKWWTKAKAQGDPDATRDLPELEKQLGGK